MRQYWINFNGEQKGPMSLEQMAKTGIDETAYVWHSGLSDWVKITAVPELKEMLENTSGTQLPETETQPIENEEVPELPEREEVPQLPEKEVAPQLPNNVAQRRYYQRPVTSRAAASEAPKEIPECPPTNLVWAIISTVFCCTIIGIVGIIFACLTRNSYKNGDFKRAERMSEYGAWAVIASIIFGLITAPLSCANLF
jgi:hypothetical protein